MTTAIVLLLSLALAVLGLIELAVAAKLRADVYVASEKLRVACDKAEEIERKRPPLCVLLPAPFVLSVPVSSASQAACALYSWVVIRGEGRA